MEELSKLLRLLKILLNIWCLWFRASLIYINNCSTRCNTKQSIYYSASSLYMCRVSTTSITNTQNCSTVLCPPDDGCGWHPKDVQRTCRIINRLLYVVSRWKTININTLKRSTSTGIRICTSYRLHNSLLGAGAPSWHLYINCAMVHIIICGILHIVATHQIDHVTHICMGHCQLSVVYEVCPKSKENGLNFFYWTYMRLQFISVKIGSLWSNTTIPTLLPLFIAVEEVYT